MLECYILLPITLIELQHNIKKNKYEREKMMIDKKNFEKKKLDNLGADIIDT